MYSLYWMPTERDEILTLASFEVIEGVMRKDCVKGLTWTCDGDGFSSEVVTRTHGMTEVGQYYVSRF